MILLLLVACGTVHSPTCTSTPADVADDDPLEDWGVSPASLLDPVLGTREVGLRDDADTTHTTTVDVTRGAGSAVFTTVTYGDKETPSDTIGDVYLTIAVHCWGGLTVPVDVDLTSDDATVDLADPGTLSFASLDEAAQPAEATADLTDADTLPTSEADGGSLSIGFVADRLDRLRVYRAGGGDAVLTWP